MSPSLRQFSFVLAATLLGVSATGGEAQDDTGEVRREARADGAADSATGERVGDPWTLQSPLRLTDFMRVPPEDLVVRLLSHSRRMSPAPGSAPERSPAPLGLPIPSPEASGGAGNRAADSPRQPGADGGDADGSIRGPGGVRHNPDGSLVTDGGPALAPPPGGADDAARLPLKEAERLAGAGGGAQALELLAKAIDSTPDGPERLQLMRARVALACRSDAAAAVRVAYEQCRADPRALPHLRDLRSSYLNALQRLGVLKEELRRLAGRAESETGADIRATLLHDLFSAFAEIERDPAQALQTGARLFVMKSDDPTARRLFRKTAVEQGAAALGIRLCRELLFEAPGASPYWWHLGLEIAVLSRDPGLRDSWVREMKSGGGAELPVALRTADILLASGDSGEAATVLESIVASFPDRERRETLELYVGWIHGQSGRFEPAARHLLSGAKPDSQPCLKRAASELVYRLYERNDRLDEFFDRYLSHPPPRPPPSPDR